MTQTIKCLFLVLLPVAAVLGSYAMPINTPVGQLFLFRQLVLIGACSILLLNRPLSWYRDQLACYSAIFLLIWIIYGTASMFWTPDPMGGLKDIEALIFGLLLLMVLYGINVSWDMKAVYLSRGWVVAYGICVCFAVWERTTGHHLVSSFSMTQQISAVNSIVYGTLGNPNNFAATVVLAWPFVLMISDRQHITSLLLAMRIVVIVSAPILVVVAGGRLSLIAFAVQMLVWWLINVRRPKRAFAIACGAVVLVGLSAIWIRNDQHMLEKLTALVNGGFSGDTSLAVRLNVIRDGVYMLLRSGGVGVGAGGFEAIMSQGMPYWTGVIIDPHSFWMEIASEYGMLIFLCFIALFGFTFLRAWHGRKLALHRNDTISVRLNESVLLTLVGYFLVCNENSTYLTQSVNWMILATAITFLVSQRATVGQVTKTLIHA